MIVEQGLLNENIALLIQARGLLEKIGDEIYTHEASPATSSAAKHFRHIFSHYETLLKSASLKIDYETRERGTAVESSRHAALNKADELLAALPGLLANIPEGLPLRVERIVRLPDGKLEAVEYASSLARELDFVHQHTVHHFAVIALILAQHGVNVSPDFGMSPSTLRFRAALASP